jgi:hypothetical protein
VATTYRGRYSAQSAPNTPLARDEASAVSPVSTRKQEHQAQLDGPAAEALSEITAERPAPLAKLLEAWLTGALGPRLRADVAVLAVGDSGAVASTTRQHVSPRRQEQPLWLASGLHGVIRLDRPA